MRPFALSLHSIAFTEVCRLCIERSCDTSHCACRKPAWTRMMQCLCLRLGRP